MTTTETEFHLPQSFTLNEPYQATPVVKFHLSEKGYTRTDLDAGGGEKIEDLREKEPVGVCLFFNSDAVTPMLAKALADQESYTIGFYCKPNGLPPKEIRSYADITDMRKVMVMYSLRNSQDNPYQDEVRITPRKGDTMVILPSKSSSDKTVKVEQLEVRNVAQMTGRVRIELALA